MYQTYANFNSNRYNRRKFVDGALYTRLYHECTDIIYPIPNRIIEIDVTLCDTHEISTVRIIYDNNILSKELLAMNELGAALDSYTDNTSRGKKNDKGKMHIIGRGKMGNGKVGTYKLSQMSTDITDATSKLTSTLKRYYETICLSNKINEINDNKLHGQMNCPQFFASSLVQSNSLMNAAHYDVDDNTCSISTWTEKKIRCANGWFSLCQIQV